MSTDRTQRAAAAPDPARVPVDERRVEHDLVFAAAYADYVTFVGEDDTADGSWQEFFASDVSAQLAVIAIEDVDRYRAGLAGLLRTLQDPTPGTETAAMTAALGGVFDHLGTLAARLDALAGELPGDQPLRATLGNLIRTRLSPMLQQLVGYYLAGKGRGLVDPSGDPPADVVLLGRPLASFRTLLTDEGALSGAEWPSGVDAPDWAAYVGVDPAAYDAAYGEPSLTAVAEVNHLATHHLFTAVCEAFLAVLARVVDEARAGVAATYAWPGHQPHYALFLAFVRLLEHARAELNTFTGAHLDHYYRDVLRLAKRPARPDHAHVLVELAKHVEAHDVPAGTLLKAGKDPDGHDVHAVVDRDLAANRATVADLRSIRRSPDGRILADPLDPTAGDRDPFGATTPAEVGFAIASGHLALAQGTRRVEILIQTAEPFTGELAATALPCRLTAPDGWLEHPATLSLQAATLTLTLELDGNAPPIVGYDPAVHGYGFATRQPVLLVPLDQHPDAPRIFPLLAGTRVTDVRVGVTVGGPTSPGLTSLVLANDQGPLDPAQPFLAFGAAPQAGSALVIGSAEAFGKAPGQVTLTMDLMAPPVAHGTPPTMAVDHLDEGRWREFGTGQVQPVPPIWFPTDGSPLVVTLTGLPEHPAGPQMPYDTTSRGGFVRLRLGGGFGTTSYPAALAVAIVAGKEPPAPPVLPTVAALDLAYAAEQRLDLAQPSEAAGRLFAVGPFGHAELTAGAGLVPRFESAGELYLGLRDLHPPSDIALLFRVVDATANPLVVKPADHLAWSYLAADTWVPFGSTAVSDATAGLVSTGIVTLSVPAEATTEHTLLPAGLRWIRVCAADTPDAVCRLRTVTAQALRATYVRPDVAPDTITKPDPPDPAVKKLVQPDPAFGGRAVESDADFRIRVAERLRHKDRAITLWDYEHLVLEAFPSVGRVRCLNHTRYEPSTGGAGIYREPAPGHVTVVVIPDVATPDPHDPLRPATSLALLGEIHDFLARRMSCFTTLHVRNPQFEEVRLELGVRFHAGVDPGLAQRRLQEEITRFLSPWAYRAGSGPSFGASVHTSVLVDMIEELPYVEYLADARLHHLVPGTPAAPKEQVTGSRAVAVLVSVPPEQHTIHLIPAEVGRP